MFAKLFSSIQKAWRNDRKGQIEILPPLQHSRALPDPKRPHYRRVDEVREALDSAPPGLSLRKLIVYVRRRTGTGNAERQQRVPRTAAAGGERIGHAGAAAGDAISTDERSALT